MRARALSAANNAEAQDIKIWKRAGFWEPSRAPLLQLAYTDLARETRQSPQGTMAATPHSSAMLGDADAKPSSVTLEESSSEQQLLFPMWVVPIREMLALAKSSIDATPPPGSTSPRSRTRWAARPRSALRNEGTRRWRRRSNAWKRGR